MGKVGRGFLKILRVLIGLVLLGYSLCLLGSFFSPGIREFLSALGKNYKIIEFIFAGIFSTPEFLYLALFIGTIYLVSALAILSLKYNPRIGATYLLFSIWVFILCALLLKVKKGLSVGFSDPAFISDITNFFKTMVPFAIPALFLPLLGEED